MIKNFLRAKLRRKGSIRHLFGKHEKDETEQQETHETPSEITLIEAMQPAEGSDMKKPDIFISTGKSDGKASVVNNNYILSAKESPTLNTSKLKQLMSPNSPQFMELKEDIKKRLKQLSPGSPGNFNPFVSGFKKEDPQTTTPTKKAPPSLKRKKSPLSPPEEPKEKKKVTIQIPSSSDEPTKKKPMVPRIPLERAQSCIQLRADQQKPPQGNSLTPRTPRRRSRRSKRSPMTPPPPRPSTPAAAVEVERRKSLGLNTMPPLNRLANNPPQLPSREALRMKISQSLTTFGFSLPVLTAMPNLIIKTPNNFSSSFDIEDEILENGDQQCFGSLSNKTVCDSPEGDHHAPMLRQPKNAPGEAREPLPFISFRMKKITEELLKTEHAYVENLQTLYHRYMMPSKALLSDQSYTKIFHNVHTIVTINRALLMRWLKKLRGENTNSKTSTFFLDEPAFNPLEHISRKHFSGFIHEIHDALDSLRYYAPYGTSYSTTCDCLREELINNRGFKTFVDTQTLKIKAEGARCYGINSLLILPIQRIPRYRLMFTDMLNELEKHNHRIMDYYAEMDMTQELEKERDERLNWLRKLIDHMRVTTNKLNEIMFKFDDSVDINNRRMQVVDIADELGLPELIEPQRTFLAKIPVTLIKEHTSMETQTMPETKSTIQNNPPPLMRVKSAGAALRVTPSSQVPRHRAQSIDDSSFDLNLLELKNRKHDQYTLYVFNDMILCYRMKRFLFFKQRQCIPIRVSSVNHHVNMILKENEDFGGQPLIQFLISSNQETEKEEEEPATNPQASIAFACSPLDAVNLRSVLKRHFKDSCTLVI